jgi:phosphotransferase system HPr (HPr) family protein
MKRVVEEFLIGDPLGIHARPAAAAALAIRKSGARVTVRFGTSSADAASIVQMLGLGAGPQARITVEIEGEDDAIEAARAAVVEHLCAERQD